MKKFTVGIDLHGTLLDDRWKVPEELVIPLAEVLEKLKERASVFLCTGNDLSFVNRHVPQDIRAQLDGYVLETGCVISEKKKERVIVRNKEIIKFRRDLQEELEKRKGELGIDYFGRRLATVSAFTKNPRRLCEKISVYLRQNGWSDRFGVTYSSVAADIIPLGYNKFTGLEEVSEGCNIGIADSMNDKALLLEADFGFAPANIEPELLKTLRKERPVVELRGLKEFRDAVAIADKRNTWGVLEILKFISST